jgi:hypothetical protein
MKGKLSAPLRCFFGESIRVRTCYNDTPFA